VVVNFPKTVVNFIVADGLGLFQIVRIAETPEGFLDLHDLEQQLVSRRSSKTGRQLIGCFSAASNITGVVADDVATTLLLHQYGALAFWDYATAGRPDDSIPLLFVRINFVFIGIHINKASFDKVVVFSDRFSSQADCVFQRRTLPWT